MGGGVSYERGTPVLGLQCWGPRKRVMYGQLTGPNHFIIDMIWWTGLTPKQFSFPASLTYTLQVLSPHTGYGIGATVLGLRVVRDAGVHARLFVGASQSQLFRDLVNFWR